MAFLHKPLLYAPFACHDFDGRHFFFPGWGFGVFNSLWD